MWSATTLWASLALPHECFSLQCSIDSSLVASISFCIAYANLWTPGDLLLFASISICKVVLALCNLFFGGNPCFLNNPIQFSCPRAIIAASLLCKKSWLLWIWCALFWEVWLHLVQVVTPPRMRRVAQKLCHLRYMFSRLSLFPFLILWKVYNNFALLGPVNWEIKDKSCREICNLMDSSVCGYPSHRPLPEVPSLNFKLSFWGIHSPGDSVRTLVIQAASLWKKLLPFLVNFSISPSGWSLRGYDYTLSKRSSNILISEEILTRNRLENYILPPTIFRVQITHPRES